MFVIIFYNFIYPFLNIYALYIFKNNYSIYLELDVYSDMLQNVESIIFRKLTKNDWENINRPKNSFTTGGGQLYIDFPTSGISIDNWKSFFDGENWTNGTNGPEWNILIKSLGVFQGLQSEKIYQRRNATVSITEQNINSTNTKRIFAWTPDLTGFPEPVDPNNIITAPDSLYVYIVRLQNGENWAGWFQSDQPKEDWYVNTKLKSIFSKGDGYLVFDDEPILSDVSKQLWPFTKL